MVGRRADITAKLTPPCYLRRVVAVASVPLLKRRQRIDLSD
jgi:hypothetical protein